MTLTPFPDLRRVEQFPEYPGRSSDLLEPPPFLPTGGQEPSILARTSRGYRARYTDREHTDLYKQSYIIRAPCWIVLSFLCT